MLLVELTLPSGLKRVSNEPLALEHFWEPVVASCGAITLATDYVYGGYVRPKYGKIELTPDAFVEDADWPPPSAMPISLFISDNNEANRETVLVGMAHRESIANDGIVYDLYAPDYADRFTDHVYNDNISPLFVNVILGASYSLDADTSKSDSDNAPYINYTDKGDQVIIDSLSKACACAAHFFYIDGTIAYLVDMLSDNGSREITEFDFFPSSYRDDVPYSTFTCGDTSSQGSYSYGKSLSITPVFSAAGSEITKGLQRIIQTLEAPRVTLKMPITADIPKFGERLYWTDESLGQPLQAWMRVRSLSYDFDNEQLVIEGEGGLS